MKRILSLLTVLFISVLAVNAQTFTFNMRDANNPNKKYQAIVDVTSKKLSATSNGSTLFSIPYYKHDIFYSKHRIGFALRQGTEPDLTTTSGVYFIIMRDNGNLVIKLPNGTEYLMETTNRSDHIATYDRLETLLDNSSASNPVTTNQVTTSPPSNPSTNGSNKTFTVNGVSFTMVYVQGGTFTMGATSEQGSDAWDSEKPSHSVTLSSYMIGQTEVTQALWQAVMGNNPSSFTGDSRRPVEKVSWNDCQEFLRKLNSITGQNFRLPTEAEWEFAARGGVNSRGYKYSGSNNIGDVVWYDDNSGSTTHPVGTKQPNELGIYDMSGNVYEWCSDWYDKNYYSSSPSSNPQGPSSGSNRVLRGGSWYINARNCRVSNRYIISPVNRLSYNGLRLAF